MIRINLPARDCRFGLASLLSDVPNANPQFATGTTILGIIATWGLAFVAGAMGLEIIITNTQGSPNTYRIQAITPLGNYDSGTITGWVSSGTFYIVMQGAQLTVNPDCSWSLTWTGLQFWGGINTTTATLIQSWGANSMSGSGYDERLNGTSIGPAMERPTLPPVWTCSTLQSTTGSWSAGCSETGGYQYMVGSTWTSDPVAFDSSAPSPTCTCSAGLPGITGADSWSVTVAVAISASIGQGTGSVSCPGCTPGSWPYETQTSTFTSSFTSVTVKGQTPNLLAETIATAWDCKVTTGSGGPIITDGSTTTTVSTVSTTCASSRGITIANQFISCATAKPPICSPPPNGCAPLPVNTNCIYDGSSNLTWPSPPACTPSAFAWHLQDHEARVHEAVIQAGDVWYRRSAFTVPAPWLFFNQVTTFGDVTGAKMAYDPYTQLLYMLVERKTGGVYSLYQMVSGNHGQTWGAPTLYMSNALQGQPFNSLDGGFGRTYFLYDSGTSGTGKRWGSFRESGETSWPADYVFADSTNTPIELADGGWGNVQWCKGPQKLTWTPTISGETAPSFWFSINKGRNWERLT